MKTIHIDNAPNWYEYLFVVLLLLGIVGFSWYHSTLLLLVSPVIILLLYSKNASITLRRTSFEIRFKTGFLPYRTFRQHFSKVVTGRDTIEFYDNDNMVFSLDVGLAVEDKEASEISLWSDQKNMSLGNKKNCLGTFREIKQFYLTQAPGNI